MKEIRTNYFYGNEVSEYGKNNGYVDYGTLSRAFDAVLCNDVTKLFYTSINGEYTEAEQVNGFIDNSEEIEALEEKILESENDEEIEALQERIEQLEDEQNRQEEIFQYFIISDSGAEILKRWTNEIIYYIPTIDIYIWGVTHCGTSWDYVLTDIKINPGV